MNSRNAESIRLTTLINCYERDLVTGGGHNLTSEQELDQLADEKLNMKLGVRKELKRLPHHLADGEEVVNLSDGQYGKSRGLVAVTDRRVIFTSEGIGRTTFEDFPYEKISSVQTSTGVMLGEMTIHASGNKAHITQLLKTRAPEIGDYVRSRISEGSSSGSADQHQPQAANIDPTEELRKYAALRDDGIISEQEFQDKKRQIMG